MSYKAVVSVRVIVSVTEGKLVVVLVREMVEPVRSSDRVEKIVGMVVRKGKLDVEN